MSREKAVGVRLKVGGQAAALSSFRNCGYQRRNTSSNSSLRTFVRVCSNRWAPQCPLHGLFLDKAPADYLINRRLYERCANRLAVTIALPKVRDEVPVVANVDLEFAQAGRQLLRRWRISDKLQVQQDLIQPIQRLGDVSVP